MLIQVELTEFHRFEMLLTLDKPLNTIGHEMVRWDPAAMRVWPAFLRNSEDDECPVLEMEVKRLD